MDERLKNQSFLLTPDIHVRKAKIMQFIFTLAKHNKILR